MVKRFVIFAFARQLCHARASVFVAAFLIGVRGARLAAADGDDESAVDAGTEPMIDRDIIMLPNVVNEDFDRMPDIELNPVFDVLWQVAGGADFPYIVDAGNGPSRWSRTRR